ncbi:PD-(D/E)XK nuclease superfamily protein [Clostridium gasigenes]|uniref:PD-(D/E)XK nuclease superfamily protein n=1 Tax=Clostridium gasigenes TaxID=94869 RepID=A0A1H0W7F0_9CLOT|nr:hypothetical protein [Clostridium gasigenes]SDP86206.1 PD-(D/E)XK nuclease superfamily protein [Clostridium gasigenes]
MLKKKYKLISSDFIKIDRRGINVSLIKGQTSILEYENPITNERVKVAYNAKKQSKTVSQNPDNILSINKDNSTKAYEFIFDAKYKIDTTKEYSGRYNGVGPKEEDINTMHRYRDSIVYNKKAKKNPGKNDDNNTNNVDYNEDNKNCIFGTLRGKDQIKANLENNFYHTRKSNVDIVKNKIEYIALAQSKKSFGD